jgi:hypothetical protein
MGQAIQIDLMAQGRAEGLKSLDRVILAAEKAPVDPELDTLTQGVKDKGNR